MILGSSYTSGTKILDDIDEYGTDMAYQSGLIDDIRALSGDKLQVYLKI
jgi:hypothetical protein